MVTNKDYQTEPLQIEMYEKFDNAPSKSFIEMFMEAFINTSNKNGEITQINKEQKNNLL